MLKKGLNRLVRKSFMKKRGIGRKTKKQGLKGKNPLKTGKFWSLRKTDREFRKTMLILSPIKCVFPECTITDPSKLTVSHYWGRVNKGTRFNIPNCDFLCRNHHYWDKQLGWEFQKQTVEKHGWDGRYTLYMREKLGKEGFHFLKTLAESGMKPKQAILQFQHGTT